MKVVEEKTCIVRSPSARFNLGKNRQRMMNFVRESTTQKSVRNDESSVSPGGDIERGEDMYN